MVKELNFNKEHPENHNLCITNLRSNRAEVFDGNSFIVKDKMEVLHGKIIEFIDFVGNSTQEVDVDEKRIIAMTEQLEKLKVYIERKNWVRNNPQSNHIVDNPNPNYNKVYKDTENICYNHRDLVKKKKKELKNCVEEDTGSEFF